MANQNPEYLTAEELRNRLYHSLRNRGLVDSIKSQLRNSLVTELQQSVRGPLTLKDLKVPDGGTLLHRASNSLVANHLRACQYEYSLSVFLPECGLNQDKKFETQDLVKLLNISPHSRLYQRLSAQSQQDSKKGFLWQLLTEVSALHANSSSNVGCQTDLIKVGPITSLDEKLTDVDELFSSRREDFMRTGRAGAEERLLSFQRQLEDRYNTQLKLELARMRDAEIASIKTEEKENGRKALEQARRELERVYKDKHDVLVQRERNAMERLQQQTDLQDRETYAQRQSILEEIEAVRQREAEVKREAEVNKREKKVSEDRVKDKEGDLRRRELEINQKETAFEQRLQNEMAQFKLDQQARYIERIQNVEVREAKVKEEERIVSEDKSRLQLVKDELRDKTHRVNELETLLSESKYSEVNANKNNEYLNAKLRDMSDYKTLKEQVVMYKNELETLRTRLAEVLSMNERERGRQEELLRELRRPSPEALMLHRDLEKTKENLRQEQVVFEQQKQLLEARLKEELDRNKDLLQRFEEQTLQMREMNREIVDLRQNLHMTTRALNTEVYRKPADETDGAVLNESRSSGRNLAGSRHLVDFGDGDSNPKKSLRFEPDQKDVYHDVDFDLPSVSHSRAGGYLDDDVSSTDSADIIAQAKYRLKNLDREAHTLEKAYHDFHCRMTNINALPADPPPPRSTHATPQAGSQQERNMGSPRQSPIPFENPMSSTPYKRTRMAQDLNDSFAELGTQSHQQKKTSVPTQLDLSAVGDDPVIVESGDAERRVKMRSITVDDLDQRPGSPGIMVVAESVSSTDDTVKKVSERTHSQSGPPPGPVQRHVLLEPLVTVSSVPPPPVPEPAVASFVPTTTTPTVSSQPFSLDSAWKSQTEEEEKGDEEARRRQKEMEAELERQEERRREEEREEQRLNAEREKAEQEAQAAAAKEQEEEEKIDPVMKQYMAMVQQQKEKEKEVTKKAVHTWSRGHSEEKTPPQSDTEGLSAAAPDESEKDDDDDGFSW
ncbi:oral-facial-digital syndrome 1 protein homolog [Aplysia californica]|uniref:Oral-facial-digital syndrome 1 protein homolog n=1 Tax=Aplysia californica TaxID=6500 RepID=A0ABM0ZYV6_APLCA|nr:oral-facial-digital syndrome 1 protein homolog [Aplysia californica]